MFIFEFKKILPYAVDVYSKVYGEDYSDIISSKINNAKIFQYYDIDGYKDYIEYIKRCKRRELSYEFLVKLGLKNNNVQSFSSQFDDETKMILDNLIGNEFFVFDTGLSQYFAPILSFDNDNPVDKNKLIENQLKIINFIRNCDSVITKDNYEDFKKTNEFKKILRTINSYLYIYNTLLYKYNQFEKSLLSYEEFINNEKSNYDVCMYSKKIEFFNEIFPLINDEIIFKIKNLNLTLQEEIIVGNRDLSQKIPLEYFSESDMKILKSSKYSLDDKYWIIFFQSLFLKNLGINISKAFLSCENENDIFDYLCFLESENVKSYIPSADLIEHISNLRFQKNQEAIEEYYTNRKDFMYNIKHFVNHTNNRLFLLNQILNNEICVISNVVKNAYNVFQTMMFFTIKKNYGGKLMHCFMHELGHIIDQNELGCGFESFNHLYDHNERNPYDNTYRKYERFNEILTDIFALDAVEVLHENNIYLMEDKTILSDDISNFNTSSYLKSIVSPLLDKYKHYVIKSKIYSNPNYLIEAIGLHNFEAIVDSINKIDFFLRNGLFDSDGKDNYLASYYVELDKIDAIYKDIDEYYNSIKYVLEK